MTYFTRSVSQVVGGAPNDIGGAHATGRDPRRRVEVEGREPHPWRSRGHGVRRHELEVMDPAAEPMTSPCPMRHL
jgi:hypothetical protein